MRSAIVVFPGTNRENDMASALRRASGVEPVMVWHGETELPDVDLVAVPGGFAHGDYLRAGAMAARSPIMRAVNDAAGRGVRVLGVCNGFQVLTECGLLPGALMRNARLKFMCRLASLRVATSASAFTGGYAAGDVISIPIANHDGAYFADDGTLSQLRDQDRIAFHYCSEDGDVDPDSNINGSAENIAGILNANRNVLGMMPHPENATEAGMAGGEDGTPMFRHLVEALS